MTTPSTTTSASRTLHQGLFTPYRSIECVSILIVLALACVAFPLAESFTLYSASYQLWSETSYRVLESLAFTLPLTAAASAAMAVKLFVKSSFVVDRTLRWSEFRQALVTITVLCAAAVLSYFAGHAPLLAMTVTNSTWGHLSLASVLTAIAALCFAVVLAVTIALLMRSYWSILVATLAVFVFSNIVSLARRLVVIFDLPDELFSGWWAVSPGQHPGPLPGQVGDPLTYWYRVAIIALFIAVLAPLLKEASLRLRSRRRLAVLNTSFIVILIVAFVIPLSGIGRPPSPQSIPQGLHVWHLYSLAVPDTVKCQSTGGIEICVHPANEPELPRAIDSIRAIQDVDPALETLDMRIIDANVLLGQLDPDFEPNEIGVRIWPDTGDLVGAALAEAISGNDECEPGSEAHSVSSSVFYWLSLNTENDPRITEMLQAGTLEGGTGQEFLDGYPDGYFPSIIRDHADELAACELTADDL